MSELRKLVSEGLWLGLMGLWLIAGLPHSLLASHNTAGQIAVERSDPANPFTYKITLTTYTDSAAQGVDRCSATIEVWTVGPNPIKLTELVDVPRSNGPQATLVPGGCTLPASQVKNGVWLTIKPLKRNLYEVTYTFPGPGTYQLRYFDQYRIEDVVNMDSPGSTTFFVETQIVVLPPIVGENSSPILLNEPLDDACTGKFWTHNPGAVDPDGDSLSYFLRPSYQYDPTSAGGLNTPIPVDNYRFPDDPGFGTPSTFSIDPLTGVVTWDTPLQQGIYNVAIVIEEWREGTFLGFVVRDMAIFVKNCDNDPPIIETITDTCVKAGDLLEFDVRAWDPNLQDSLYFRLNNGALGNNGPFFVPYPATLTGLIIDPVNGSFPWTNLPARTRNNGVIPQDTILGNFEWQTWCSHIRSTKYQVDFYAQDNFSYSAVGSPSLATLTAHKAVTIRVVPPGPEALVLTKNERQIALSWLPGICEDTVLGYNIYRRLGDQPWMQDSICCEMSPVDAGFELIAFNNGWTNTTYLDSLTDLTGSLGQSICYVVTTLYADPNSLVQATIEGCASNQVCAEIENDDLFLTNDSVAVTDPVNGEIFVSWNTPVVDEFYPAPYQFELFRGDSTAYPTQSIGTFSYSDTTFLDTGLDTDNQGYNYRVEIYDANGLLISTDENRKQGSSIYLETDGANGSMNLRWKEVVPWFNDRYEIYRSEDGDPFQLLTTVNGTGDSLHNYIDQNLSLTVEYCYFIRSFGSHNEPNVKPELINDSQISCNFARDTTPPCQPLVSAEGDCETLIQRVTITKPEDDCASDIDYVAVFFADNPEGNYVEVDRVNWEDFSRDTTLEFTLGGNITVSAGCFATMVADTFGNQSGISEPYCIDFCPEFEMSNVFTPNNDGVNDFFKPARHRDIRLVQIWIYDRWGRLVHETNEDIDRLWNGESRLSGAAKPGVYYYFMRYEELSIFGNRPKEIKGWVTLIR